MTGPKGRLVVASGLAPTLAVALLSLWRPAFVGPFEYSVYDALLRSIPAHAPSDRIVIVDVDERSLAALGQWPWRRDVMARLIDRLRDLGASTVALDIIFAEADRSDVGDITPDVILANSLRPGRVLLGYAAMFGESPAASTCVPHPLGVAVIRADEDRESEPFFRATSVICNLPILTQSAQGSGFLNAAPDPDGILRRAPVLVQLDGRIYPSLALATIAADARTREAALRVVNVNASQLTLAGGTFSLTVPLDGKSNLLLRYRGPKRTFQYISAADILSAQVPRSAVEGKLVFVGTTALGTREVVSTPLDTLFTGVEVQATVADNLMQQDFIHRPELGVALETQAVFWLGIAAIALVTAFGVAQGAIAVAACLALLWAAAVWLLANSGTLFSPLYPTLGLTTTLAAMTAAGLRSERRRADQEGRDRAASQRLMIEALLSLTEARDAETGKHSRRTQQYARILAHELSKNPRFHEYLTPERVDLLATLAPLHDIGKVGVPDQLLNKVGPLAPHELAELRKHPEYARDAIAQAERQAGVRDDAIMAMAKDIAYTHHEWWDGTGYPQGLRGEQIPLVGRVIAVVDVYDALRSHRPYSEPLGHSDAVARILAGRGTHFDPAVVDAFVKVTDSMRRVAADAGLSGTFSAIGAGQMPRDSRPAAAQSGGHARPRR